METKQGLNLQPNFQENLTELLSLIAAFVSAMWITKNPTRLYAW